MFKLVELLLGLLKVFEYFKRKKKEQEQEEAREEIQDDPAKWLDGHFNDNAWMQRDDAPEADEAVPRKPEDK